MPRKKKSVLEEEEEEDVFGDNEDVDAQEREKFYREVNEFMEKRGTPIPHDNLPQLGGRRLNVYKLWLQVWGRGGYEAVCENKQWTEVRDSYQVPKTCTSASYSLKMYYQKWLYSFEQVMKLGKVDPIQKQTPHVLEQQKQQASGTSTVKKIAAPKKRPPPSSTSLTSLKSRKIERENIIRKKPISTILNFQSLKLSNEYALQRRRETEQEHSVLTIQSLASAFEHYSDGFFNRIDVTDENLLKEIEYARRIDCGFKSDDENLREWSLYQVLRLSQYEYFRCEHIPGLISICEDILIAYATQVEKQNSLDDGDIFNLKNQEYLESQHKALMVISLLRNASFLSDNQSMIGKSNSLIDILVFMLRNDSNDILHLEWRLRIIDIIINASEVIDFSSNNVISRFISYTLDSKETDSMLLSASCLETLNYVLKNPKNNLSTIEEILQQDPKIIGIIVEFLQSPAFLKTDNQFEYEDDKMTEGGEDEDEGTNENKEEIQSFEKKRLSSITSRLSDIELLCRMSSINFLSKLVELTKSTQLLESIVNSNGCIDKLITLIVWKSNLYNRIEQYPYLILQQVKENEKEKNAEGGELNIFMKSSIGKSLFEDIDDYDEKNDIEEIYDGYDGCFTTCTNTTTTITSTTNTSTDHHHQQDQSNHHHQEQQEQPNHHHQFNDDESKKISDSLKFQKKCASILQSLSKKVESTSRLSQFTGANREFMYLILLGHPSVSKILSSLLV